MDKADKIKLFRQRAGNIPLGYKIAMAAASLIFFLFLTEVSLRIVGALFFSRDKEMVHFGEKSSDNRVMCVGDSFTWGGRGPRQDAYPALLSNVLAEKFPKMSFAVINRGVCETNSRYVMEIILAHRLSSMDVIHRAFYRHIPVPFS